MLTIQDIANRANVAKSTVSRFLNGGSVSHQTKQKLQQVIEETGYVPNVFAQSLKSKTTGLIGVIIPRIGSRATDLILQGIDEITRENKQSMFILNTNQNVEQELQALKTFAKQKVDFIVFIATQITQQHIDLITQLNIQVIIVGQKVKALYSISYDDYLAGKLIGEYIVRLKHQHVLYFNVGTYDKAVGIDRKKGLIDVLQHHSIRYDIVETSFIWEQAYEQALKILPTTQATYIVCATDNIALGVMKAIYELGFSIPKDFSISGFGGYNQSIAIHPTLTTVNFPYLETGKQVIRYGNQGVDKENSDVLTVSLMVNQSTMENI